MPSSFETNQEKVSLELRTKSLRSTKPTIIAYAIFAVTRDLLKMTAQPSHILATNTGSPFNLRLLDTNTRIPSSVKFKHSSKK